MQNDVRRVISLLFASACPCEQQGVEGGLMTPNLSCSQSSEVSGRMMLMCSTSWRGGGEFALTAACQKQGPFEPFVRTDLLLVVTLVEWVFPESLQMRVPSLHLISGAWPPDHLDLWSSPESSHLSLLCSTSYAGQPGSGR